MRQNPARSGVHFAQAHLKDAEDPLAGVETAVDPGRRGVLGDERGKTWRSERNSRNRFLDRGIARLGEDLSSAEVSHQKVVLANGHEQKG